MNVIYSWTELSMKSSIRNLALSVVVRNGKK